LLFRFTRRPVRDRCYRNAPNAVARPSLPPCGSLRQLVPQHRQPCPG